MESFSRDLPGNPQLGAVIKGGGGIRKIRVPADLTPKQIAQLAKVVKEEFGNEKGDV